jgi:hypothetical protein
VLSHFTEVSKVLTLQESSLDWALQHVCKYGDTDLFPRPFEIDAIQHDWGVLKAWLNDQDVLEWPVRPHRSLLTPKSREGFRVVTQLDPLDTLIFLATIYEIAPDLERSRAPASRNLVHSYRFLPDADGQMFDPAYGYSSFQKVTQGILAECDSSHVGMTDIADFYPRIYHHRLEGALEAATTNINHVRALRGLLKGWNATETFGIPVGNAGSRLLAEVTIADVDEFLLAQGVRFLRFNDDYRIFGTSYTDVYRQLAALADSLYRNHGLTLQPQKTRIVETTEFERRFLPAAEDREIESLRERFEVLVGELGLTDWYQEIEYEDLEPEQQELVDSLNLTEFFEEEVNSGNPDITVVRFIYRRLGQLGDASVVDQSLNNMELLYPAFPDMIEYLRNLRHLDIAELEDVGKRVLDLLDDSIITELEYHRMWALDLFTRSTEWDNEERFFSMLANASDQFTRRKAMLAMGRAGQRPWFQSNWRRVFDEAPWPRRALLAAGSCMPSDPRKHWYKSVMGRLDPLEQAVVKWAQANPFSP